MSMTASPGGRGCNRKRVTLLLRHVTPLAFGLTRMVRHVTL